MPRTMKDLLHSLRRSFCLKPCPKPYPQLLAVVVTALIATNANGSEKELPALGNSEKADKEMAIEISDQFVWTPPGSVQSDASRRKIDLWQKIATSSRMPVHVNPLIDEYKKRLKKDDWSYEKILKRATPFLSHIVGRLEARGLPLDLALLPVIESGYQTHVKSENQAAGLWQIVPATASEIGLKRTAWFDDRSDVFKSTRAALDYLSFINAEFDGNWEHTLAAYNAGPGRVRSAIRRNRKAGLSTDIWMLRLPTETSVYVARFIALAELVRQTPSPGLELPEVTAEPYLQEIEVSDRISLDVAASLTGVSEKSLRKYNGGLLYGVTPPNGPHRLVLPAVTTGKFKKAFTQRKKTGKRLYTLLKTHTVVAGDSVGSLALAYGLSQRKFRELNNLDSDVIKIGQKLAVVDNRSGRSAASEPSSSQSSLPNGTAVGYTIKSGDTLSQIAVRFNVAIEQIRLENGKLPNARKLIPGKKLQIYKRDS